MGSDNVEPTPYTGKFRLFGRSEWETPPGMRWLIDGIIPLHASVLMFGQTKIEK